MNKWQVVTNHDTSMGHIVEADSFTIEVSGAATFWRIIVRGELSELIIAFAPGMWHTIEKVTDNG